MGKRPAASDESLPEIPDKRYFTITEVGELCGVKNHVLRYWETVFPNLKPCKKRGNRRYYQKKDIELVREIRELLYLKGYTISGAVKQFSDNAIQAKQKSSKSKQINEIIRDLNGVVELLS